MSLKNIVGGTQEHKSSTLALLFGNLVPLAMVFFFDSGVYDILYFYWIECLVIGCLTIVRIVGMLGRDLSVFLAPPIICIFLLSYSGLLFTTLYLIESMPVLTDLIIDDVNRLGELRHLNDPLSLLVESVRPGTVGCLIGFCLGQGIAFWDRHRNSEDFRYARAMRVVGHAFQRVLILYFVVGLGVFLMFVDMGTLYIILLFTVFKAGFDLYENSSAFDPENLFGVKV